LRRNGRGQVICAWLMVGHRRGGGGGGGGGGGEARLLAPCLELVRAAQPSAEPNRGFLQQLRWWEAMHCGRRRERTAVSKRAVFFGIIGVGAVLTAIHPCDACSCQEILGMETGRQAELAYRVFRVEIVRREFGTLMLECMPAPSEEEGATSVACF
jgi:hypothetical protein